MPGLPSQAPTSSTGLSYPEIKEYRIVQHIGGGGFSRVFRAITAANVRHKVAAIKVVSYAKPSSQTLHPQHAPDRAALKKEVQIHNVLKHKNVLEFLAVDEFMPGESRTSNYVPGLYMVLELGAGGDLFDKIAPDVGLDEDTAHFYFSQLIDGLEYIHSQGVAHRDVKPENLLLDADGCLKLADFGLCSVYRYKGKERQLKGACGSLPYIAPEMNGNPYRGEQADVWSTGVVLFALLVGNTPWDEPTRRSAEFVAYTRGQSYDPWPRIPDDALSLVRHMLCVDPDKRYTIAAIKEHRWFRRPNSLRSDPVTLAERLLHGLIVSGDMDFGLHSDGRRAPVPENISLTQPEAFGPGLQSFDERLPPSSAHPALGNGRGRAATTTTTNARHLAMSQQVSARRDNVPPASAADGAGLVAGAASSQFTQAMNHMTQWSAVAGGTARFSPHLTRLFCSAPPSDVVQRIVGILAELSIVYHAAPLGFRGDEEEDEAHGGHDIAEEAEGDDDSMMEDVEMSDGAAAPAAAAAARGTTGSSSSSAALVGSRGARIRVRTMDRRKCLLQGEVRVAEITRNGSPVLEDEDSESRVAKTYVLMRRSKGDPLEWRRLFRALANHESLKPLAVTSH